VRAAPTPISFRQRPLVRDALGELPINEDQDEAE